MKMTSPQLSKSPFTHKYRRALLLATAALSLSAVSGHCVNAAYPSVVIGDGALGYYRFNDSTNRTNINLNMGSLGAAGNATNLNTHTVNDGAVNGSYDAATYFNSTARTIVPWNAALNPNASNDFTVEGWFNPATDGTFGNYAGPSPIMNRFSGAAINRQGWVIFQRSPDSTYANPDGVGWTFRTYTGVGSDVGVQLTSQVPYRLGEWQHVAVVWSGATQTATMYINGTNVGSGTNTSADPNAYVANTDTTGDADAPNGPAGFSIGAYNNTDPGADPFSGAIDEVAFYSKQLSPAQLLAHYQNATNASRAEYYHNLVESDGPVGYWRLDDQPATTNDVAVNQGTVQATGIATNTAQVRHPGSSPLVSRASSSTAYHFRNGDSTTDMPWLAANNPPASVPFSLELWVRPTWDQIDTGEAPINNRYVSSGNRTGWVIFQRDPNQSYEGTPGASGVGWTFRMYSGTGSSGQDVLTGVPYNVGEWQHLVFTWQPTNDIGDGANGVDAWQGTQTAYVDGVAVATNTSLNTYCANQNPTEDSSVPADFAIGSYNIASGLGNNPFEGEVSEIAFYNNYLLTSNQIMDHYQARTNTHPATNYQTLVLTAAITNNNSTTTQGLQPATYLRLNEPAFHPATNSGSLGSEALGSLVDTINDVPGPITSGFELSNLAIPVGQRLGWASLDNPPGLIPTNHLTLEAWIMPSGYDTNEQTACIISYGPPTPTAINLSVYTAVTNSGVTTSSNEISLSIVNDGSATNTITETNYSFSYYDGTNTHGVTYPVGSDLANSNWVHLAGTYDGTTWALYRNGVNVTNSVDAVTNLSVPGSDWAIGSTGEGWTNYFDGSIDEVAIYSTALTSNTINAHYYVGQSGSVSLTISRTGASQVTLTWAAGTLQSAMSLTGPWTDLPAAKSPYPISDASGTLFYRVKL